jgi:hypothetical protein
MQTIFQTRERLLDRLKQIQEAGDLDTAAMLEYGISEFDGVIALLASLTRRGPMLLH